MTDTVTDAQRAREVLEALNDGDIDTALKITRLQYYHRGQEEMQKQCARFADGFHSESAMIIAAAIRLFPITGRDDAVG